MDFFKWPLTNNEHHGNNQAFLYESLFKLNDKPLNS